ncbi:Acyltransferase family protein [Gimesia maris]|uniref:acyltransferase family protein n=1 Tax=Gimesia maris TaxID=122 RepID=UPI00118CA4FD|nr:acyltransferase [Gimesia maris]QDU12374.1 Acyltransferase family protein [Gimesia maris]
MKSSAGKYYIGLDHLRAIAAFMVFSFHFIHIPFPFSYDPTFIPFSLVNEGHTGVALFMTLSGYLFAKLLDGKRIKYGSFLWNRFLRLAPLLFFMVTMQGIYECLHGTTTPVRYFLEMLKGVVMPILPNGGWSITVEFHFYLVLPILLYLSRKSKYSLCLTVCCAILLRLMLREEVGHIQSLAYLTIVGRIDQFLLGMIAFQLRDYIQGRHFLVLSGFTAFAIFYWYFDKAGGSFHNPSYPSNRLVWVYLPTIEGLVYALIIAWYDNSFVHSHGRVSRFVALIGTYSYSIYLLHMFFQKLILLLLERYIMPVSSMPIAFCFSVLGFLIMVPVAALSFRFIESPFLKLRTRYLIDEPAESTLEMKTAEETETLPT